MDKKTLIKILGRNEYNSLLGLREDKFFKNKKVLITGAGGSIGMQLSKTLKEENIDYLATDIEGDYEYLDITDYKNCFSIIQKYNPDFIVNIAGLKYATKSEHQTWKTVQVNIEGTKNLLNACSDKNKLILTSTGKACDAEIVYGATKLIAERITLNGGGGIARFVNVVQTQGNVFDIWNNIPLNETIDVANKCSRYFISLDEACSLILFTIKNKSGRYLVNVPESRSMHDIANAIYPARIKNYIPCRRGDRLHERFLSSSENIEDYFLDNSVIKVHNQHDRLTNFIG